MGALSGVWGYGRSRDLRLPRRHGNAHTQCTDCAASRHYQCADPRAGHSCAAGYDRHADHAARNGDRSGTVAERSSTVSV